MCSPSSTKGRPMRNVLQKGRIGHGVLQLKTTKEMRSGDSVVAVSTSYTLCTRVTANTDLSALKSIHACKPLVKYAFSFLPTLPLIATARKESTIIFTCDENAGIGSPYLLSETLGCAVTFEWKTQAVCPPKKMECKFVQKHRTYDLRMLSSLTGSWIFFHNGNS